MDMDAGWFSEGVSLMAKAGSRRALTAGMPKVDRDMAQAGGSWLAAGAASVNFPGTAAGAVWDDLGSRLGGTGEGRALMALALHGMALSSVTSGNAAAMGFCVSKGYSFEWFEGNPCLFDIPMELPGGVLPEFCGGFEPMTWLGLFCAAGNLQMAVDFLPAGLLRSGSVPVTQAPLEGLGHRGMWEEPWRRHPFAILAGTDGAGDAMKRLLNPPFGVRAIQSFAFGDGTALGMFQAVAENAREGSEIGALLDSGFSLEHLRADLCSGDSPERYPEGVSGRSLADICARRAAGDDELFLGSGIGHAASLMVAAGCDGAFVGAAMTAKMMTDAFFDDTGRPWRLEALAGAVAGRTPELEGVCPGAEAIRGGLGLFEEDVLSREPEWLARRAERLESVLTAAHAMLSGPSPAPRGL